MIFIVRHASAGVRGSWDDDSQRPLDDKGVAQARALPGVITEAMQGGAVARLLASPYLRCRQTLQPLAETWGLDVTVDPRLAEESPIDGFRQLLDEATDATVMCSHGDMIPAVLKRLEYEGIEWLSAHDPRTAAVHVLERDGSRFTKVWCLAPPR